MSFGANIIKLFCYTKVWHKICFIWHLFMKTQGPVRFSVVRAPKPVLFVEWHIFCYICDEVIIFLILNTTNQQHFPGPAVMSGLFFIAA